MNDRLGSLLFCFLKEKNTLIKMKLLMFNEKKRAHETIIKRNNNKKNRLEKQVFLYIIIFTILFLRTLNVINEVMLYIKERQ